MKKIIIFGATGNVGSYVHKYACEYFDTQQYQVIASGRRSVNYFAEHNYEYVPVDVTKEEQFENLPTEDVFAVIYLAAVIPSYMKEYKPEQYINGNIIGFFNVLEYCRRVKVDRIIFSTTVFDISLYAEPGVVLKPDLEYNFSYSGDHAVYVITKNTAIELLKHYHAEYGLKYFVFRFPTIYNYSPYQFYYPNGVKTIRPVYKMINQAIKGEPIELWGDPNYSKDMVHVYDCAQMLCKAIEVDRDKGWYNVGTGVPVTLEEEINAIIDVFSDQNHRSPIIFKPEYKNGGGFLMDVENAKQELGYEPQYDVHRLFENYKYEMQVNRFEELRSKE